MELRGYSPCTVESYSKYLFRFLNFTSKSIESLDVEDLRVFLHHLITKNLSTFYINSVYSSSQLFYTHVLKKPLNLNDVLYLKVLKSNLLFYLIQKLVLFLVFFDSSHKESVTYVSSSSSLHFSRWQFI